MPFDIGSNIDWNQTPGIDYSGKFSPFKDGDFLPKPGEDSSYAWGKSPKRTGSSGWETLGRFAGQALSRYGKDKEDDSRSTGSFGGGWSPGLLQKQGDLSVLFSPQFSPYTVYGSGGSSGGSVGGALSGGMQGAMAGAPFGPGGIIAGALIGGTAGALG